MCEKCRAAAAAAGINYDEVVDGRVPLTQEQVRAVRARMLSDDRAGPFGSRYVPHDANGPMTRESRIADTRRAMAAVAGGVGELATMLHENPCDDGGITFYVGLASPSIPKEAKRFSVTVNAGHILFMLSLWRFRLCIGRYDITRMHESYAMTYTQMARILEPAAMDLARLMHPASRSRVEASELQDAIAESVRTRKAPPTTPSTPTPPPVS